eukprot:858450-Pelagomonas_calceolata.AAC.4
MEHVRLLSALVQLQAQVLTWHDSIPSGNKVSKLALPYVRQLDGQAWSHQTNVGTRAIKWMHGKHGLTKPWHGHARANILMRGLKISTNP